MCVCEDNSKRIILTFVGWNMIPSCGDGYKGMQETPSDSSWKFDMKVGGIMGRRGKVIFRSFKSWCDKVLVELEFLRIILTESQMLCFRNWWASKTEQLFLSGHWVHMVPTAIIALKQCFLGNILSHFYNGMAKVVHRWGSYRLPRGPRFNCGFIGLLLRIRSLFQGGGWVQVLLGFWCVLVAL